MIALTGVNFGHHDLQTSFKAPYFFKGGFIKERVHSDNPRSPEALDITMSILLPAETNTLRKYWVASMSRARIAQSV